MTADRPRRAVVDASVLLAVLNRDESDHDVCRELVEDAEDGQIELWAPIVVLVEVGRWTRDADPADPDARTKLEDFLDSPWLTTIEVHRGMIDAARDVVASTTVKTGIDGLYFATAHLHDIETVYTLDGAMLTADFHDVVGRKPPGSQAPKLDLDGATGGARVEADEDAPVSSDAVDTHATSEMDELSGSDTTTPTPDKAHEDEGVSVERGEAPTEATDTSDEPDT